jgi:hypothetical protein
MYIPDAQEEIEGDNYEIGNHLLQRVVGGSFIVDDIKKYFYREGNLRLGGGICGSVAVVEAGESEVEVCAAAVAPVSGIGISAQFKGLADIADSSRDGVGLDLVPTPPYACTAPGSESHQDVESFGVRLGGQERVGESIIFTIECPEPPGP